MSNTPLSSLHSSVEKALKKATSIDPRCHLTKKANGTLRLYFEDPDTQISITIAYVRLNTPASPAVTVMPGIANSKMTHYTGPTKSFNRRISELSSKTFKVFDNKVDIAIHARNVNEKNRETVSRLNELYGIDIYYDSHRCAAALHVDDPETKTFHSFSVNLGKETVSLKANGMTSAGIRSTNMEVPLHVFVNFKNEIAMTALIT